MTEQNPTTSNPVIDDKLMRNLIIDAIQDKKGKAISIVDLSEIESAPAPEFIVCAHLSRLPQSPTACATLCLRKPV